jgi:hypothetical protein
MAPRIYELRVWIALAAVVMSGLAIWRIVGSTGLHGVGEGIITVVLWGLALWGFRARSADARHVSSQGAAGS